ncbi:protein NPC2 homolog [Copidosoma floridanum]|uniref:protein NPC2 homolog n=1 Tax=Copidosoma floridanum TaxID=29053 RepID=UPI0006C97563|nr:protein NPC2 homolog [Copidosoma floridanum]
MTRAVHSIFVLLSVVAFISATKVSRCKTDVPRDSLLGVNITGCDTPPCILKKSSTVHIVQKFIPSEDIKNLTTIVSATIAGIDLPFIGVNGVEACTRITGANGAGGCPLKKGVEYIYSNSFNILGFYPAVALRVHWALKEEDKNITCFEVPARIV